MRWRGVFQLLAHLSSVWQVSDDCLILPACFASEEVLILSWLHASNELCTGSPTETGNKDFFLKSSCHWRKVVRNNWVNKACLFQVHPSSGKLNPLIAAHDAKCIGIWWAYRILVNPFFSWRHFCVQSTSVLLFWNLLSHFKNHPCHPLAVILGQWGSRCHLWHCVPWCCSLKSVKNDFSCACAFCLGEQSFAVKRNH